MNSRDITDFIRAARQAGRSDKEIVEELLRDDANSATPRHPEPTEEVGGGSIDNGDSSPRQGGTQNDTVSDSREVLISVQNLEKTYHVSDTVQVQALRDVTLDIHKGEFLSVTGQSGSGKSTLLNLLALIDQPTGGTITVEDEDISEYDETEAVQYRLRTVSMVFQFFNLIENYTAIDNIIFQLMLQGYGRGQARDQAAQMLEFLGLADKQHSYPKDLSGGQQQRVAVGRALAKDSLFILADEPTAHLDARTGQELIDLLRQINQEFNRTIIMVSHEKMHAKQADRMITLKDGVVAA